MDYKYYEDKIKLLKNGKNAAEDLKNLLQKIKLDEDLSPEEKLNLEKKINLAKEEIAKEVSEKKGLEEEMEF